MKEVFMTKIKIDTPYITLTQLLKMTDIVQSGGEARMVIQTMNILVNNESETRRGRKLYPNDIIDVEGKKFTIE